MLVQLLNPTLFGDPEEKVVALVRCRGEQQEIAGVPFKGFAKLIVLSLLHLAANTRGGQMVGLIEDDQIPAWRFEQALDTCGAFQGIDTCNQPIVFSKGVRLTIGDVTLRSKDLEVEVEDL